MPRTVAKPTNFTCAVCSSIQIIPSGTDPTLMRCVNVEALWHASYQEAIVRLTHTKNHIDGTIGTMTNTIIGLTNHMSGINKTVASIKDDAKRLADAIGA